MQQSCGQSAQAHRNKLPVMGAWRAGVEKKRVARGGLAETENGSAGRYSVTPACGKAVLLISPKMPRAAAQRCAVRAARHAAEGLRRVGG